MGKKGLLTSVFLALVISIGFSHNAIAQLKPGDPIEGRDGWMAFQMAVEEINAKGGVTVGKAKHPLKAYSIDTKEHEPGIPVHDALTAAEKLILERKPHAIVLGNFRTEVLLSTTDLISKYKLLTFAVLP